MSQINKELGMPKTVAYYYPCEKEAANLKMYQDRTNQIKAFYFTKDNIKKVEKLETSDNYAVYFLFNNSEDDEKRVYIGQSINGVKRIENHIKKKEFWSYCIMMVTDNNSFDKLTIDYLEYEFIKKAKKSSYILANKDLRNSEPNISVYDEPKLKSFADQIEFLLRTEGITFTDELTEAKKKEQNIRYYLPSNRYNAKLFVLNGKFILAKGSELKRPKAGIDSNFRKQKFCETLNALIDDYIVDGKVFEIDDNLRLEVDLSFDAPSRPAKLVSGIERSGWDFFKGLKEEKN